jgi:hypothetical protein
MGIMNGRCHFTKSQYRSRRSSLAGFLTALVLLLWPRPGGATGPDAGGPQADEPRTTLVIFADRRMTDRQWTALFAALERNEKEAATETQDMSGAYELVRGDTMETGRPVRSAIVVHLHGDCKLSAFPRNSDFEPGALGWAPLGEGRVEPYAHVNCSLIGQVLESRKRMLNLDENQRDALMSGAIARVILHECIHIVTQNPAHAERGIAKAHFKVQDLMDGDVMQDARTEKSR